MILGSEIWGIVAVVIYSKYGETGFRKGEACGNLLKPYTFVSYLVTLNFFTNKRVFQYAGLFCDEYLPG